MEYMPDSYFVDYIFDRIGHGAFFSDVQNLSMVNVKDGCASEAVVVLHLATVAHLNARALHVCVCCCVPPPGIREVGATRVSARGPSVCARSQCRNGAVRVMMRT